MLNLCLDIAMKDETITSLVLSVLLNLDKTVMMQFLLDSSSMAEVVLLKQSFGMNPLNKLFYITRTWCYSIHRNRMTQLGLPEFR